VRARRLVDSIQAFGAQSLYLRDPPLHYFVRGLLLARAGRHAAAADEYRAALVSPTFGYMHQLRARHEPSCVEPAG
jgi:hypothetical protein